MKKIDTTPRTFPPAKAEEIAAMMGAEDEDWTYAAKHDPKGTGYSLIEIHDEDGEFVAYVT